MTSKTIAAPALKKAKPRLSAEERRAAQEAARAERQAAQKAAADEFEANRRLHWLTLWTKALELSILIQAVEGGQQDFTAANRWWFDDFSINVYDTSFRIETLGGAPVSEKSLHASDVGRLNEALDQAFQWREEHIAFLDKELQKELEKKRVCETALAKLTDEERKALGFR